MKKNLILLLYAEGNEKEMIFQSSDVDRGWNEIKVTMMMVMMVTMMII